MFDENFDELQLAIFKAEQRLKNKHTIRVRRLMDDIKTLKEALETISEKGYSYQDRYFAKKALEKLKHS